MMLDSWYPGCLDIINVTNTIQSSASWHQNQMIIFVFWNGIRLLQIINWETYAFIVLFSIRKKIKSYSNQKWT